MRYVVLDNTKEKDAIVGPSTRVHVYDSIDRALQIHPEAKLRRDLELGDPLEVPVIFPDAASPSGWRDCPECGSGNTLMNPGAAERGMLICESCGADSESWERGVSP